MTIAKVNAADKYREGARPLCACHGQPMYWTASAAHRGGGRWRCSVSYRDRSRRRYHDPALQSQIRQRALVIGAGTRARNRLFVAAELIRRGGACVKCGASEAIEWHHRDPQTKRFGIGAAGGHSVAVLEAELAKCDPLCRSCHREVHR